MSGKKRQTFDKMNRERAVREKRARKAEKKEQRKLDALALENGEPVDGDAAETDSVDEPSDAPTAA